MLFMKTDEVTAIWIDFLVSTFIAQQAFSCEHFDTYLSCQATGQWEAQKAISYFHILSTEKSMTISTT